MSLMITMSSKRPVAAAVATGLLATRSRRVPLAVAAILGTMTGARTIAGGRGGHCPLARGEDGKEERKEEDEITEDGKRVEEDKVDGKEEEHEEEGMKLVFSLYEERKLTRSVSTPPK